MKLLRLSALLVALSLAACTSSSPGPALSDPGAPSFDGSASGGGATGGVAGTASSDTTGVADGGSGRGGASLGSGN